MEKTDGKRLSPETQFELRKQAIRLREQGIPNLKTAEILGMSKGWCSRTWQTYQREGMEGITPKPRGRKLGEKRRLSPEQEAETKRLLVEYTPDELGLPFALWSRDAVIELIRVRFSEEFPRKTASNYLRRWKFTPKRPIKRAIEQNPEAVRVWMEQEYPKIRERAQKEDGEIHWGDETGIQIGAYRARGFSPMGKAPVVKLPAKREKISLISAITNFGTVRFMIYEKALTARLFIEFMRRLIRDADRKVFLILDNLPVHHGEAVKAFALERKDKIELFYLPGYAPERNPDEYLNNDLKGSVHSGPANKTKDDLKRRTRSFMHSIQKRPDHVAAYFDHPQVSYINGHV